ncbi:TPA: ZIP family metal transporter [Candidatus Micrarchaeota archaeon]|nr:ZIP family metal transporter [Candidatus Micrarchaeota archaeon]
MVLELIIAATVLVSLISLIGIVLVFLGKKRIDEILFFLISFSTGTLLGAALFDLLPEASKGIDISAALELAFVGIIVAFVMEKIIHWHHHHAAREREHTHPLGMLTLVGDAFHNFFDGVAIAAAFLVNVPLGLTTTLAIALHEIPQEIGDFGLLLFSGYTKKKALAFNFLSALAAVAGGVLFFFFSGAVLHMESYALAFTAGMFIYIASADLLPEIHKEKRAKSSALQLFFLLLGAFAIWLIARTLE